MSGKGSKGKTRKPLETSLGQAPPTHNDNGPDLAHLQKPIETSIHGVKQILTMCQGATEEVRNYLFYECDIMYECRKCRTIFRSLANFILHKRKYCTGKFSSLNLNSETNERCFVIETDQDLTKNSSPLISDEETTSRSQTPLLQENRGGKPGGLSAVIDNLVRKQEMQTFAKNILNKDLSQNAKDTPDISVSRSASDAQADVLLQKIDASNFAVFQTLKNTGSDNCSNFSSGIKSEVMEIHCMENGVAILDANGKIANPKPQENLLICTECDQKFSTKKTLTYHVKYKHNKTCIVYPCPDCKESYATAWGVYRHLFKVHRRTMKEVKKMRAQIHSTAVPREQEPARKVKKEVQQLAKINEENEWMANFEDDKDLQMCGGCGRRFERKAALQSHSQTCTKRIAVCNAINNSNANSSTSQNNNGRNSNYVSSSKHEKLAEKTIAKGSARRKPDWTIRAIKEFKSRLQAAHALQPSPSMRSVLKVKDFAKLKTKDHLETPTTDNTLMKDAVSDENDKMTDDDPLRLDLSDDENDNQRYGMDSNDNSPEKIEPVEIFDVSDSSVESVMEILEIHPSPSNDCDDNNSASNQTMEILPKKEQTSTPPVFTCKLLKRPTTFNVANHQFNKKKFLDDCNLKISPNQPFNNQKKRKRSASCDLSPDPPDQFEVVHDNFVEKVDQNSTDCDFTDNSLIARSLPFMRKKDLKCTACQTSYSSDFDLLWHMSLHFNWYKFQCGKCEFMSFNENECVAHCYIEHDITNELLQNSVLPMAKSKTISLAQNFKEMSEVDLSGRNYPAAVPKNPETNSSSCNSDESFEIQPEEPKSLQSSPETCVLSSQFEPGHNKSTDAVILTETIILEDDDDDYYDQSPDTKDISGDNNATEVIDSTMITPEKNKRIKIENGSGSKSKSPQLGIALSRPVRNRQQSVKTLQSDFIYDLKRAVKLNDNPTTASTGKINGGGSGGKSYKKYVGNK